MRLWTLHPMYLDAKGLVALWREGLLAKAVLGGNTKGYRKHPQLLRFQAHEYPLEALCEYLAGVLAESKTREYHFDASKLPDRRSPIGPIEETSGQLAYEWRHLLAKLDVREPDLCRRWSRVRRPKPHPLFTIVAGNVRSWEKV